MQSVAAVSALATPRSWDQPWGEGGISPETGIFYPWVCEVLARQFGGLVLEPEHRFYGESLPYGPASYEAEHLKGATWSEDGDGSKFGPLKKNHWFLMVILVILLLARDFIFHFLGMR